MSLEVLEVQEGVWIAEELIRDAGLGHRLHVIVAPGEIRLVAAREEEMAPGTEKGWQIFRSLGQHASEGRLPDASVDHDRYLYSKD